MGPHERGALGGVPGTPPPKKMTIRLEDLPNIGPSIASNLRRIGVNHPCDLVGQRPEELYRALCQATGVRHDPCLLDVFISAVRFAEGEPARPWWYYTAERKQKYALTDP
jgi:hypothetical protein